MALTRRTVTQSCLPPLITAIGLLGLFAGVCQSGKQPAGKRAPRIKSTGVEPEVGEMNPGLAEALNGFEAGRQEECRRLAGTLAPGRLRRRPGARYKRHPDASQ